MYISNVEKSFSRLSSDMYHIGNLFRPADYDWPGDWEGRALLAFCRLYSITGRKIPAMDQMVTMLPEKTNSQGFFGAAFDNAAIDEQQLSGQSWYLRGLVAYGELFPQSIAMDYAKKTVHNLFIPALQQYHTYPIQRRNTHSGGVSGNIDGKTGNWRLSTDVGCAFIPIDGLAHYYAATQDQALKPLLEAAVEKFVSLDKVGLKMQTHATLTATRGILKLYEVTSDSKYLAYAKALLRLYTECGMTATYENYNWFGRSHEEIWTEPCAVVDSLILALELYRLTGEESYRRLARRIWFNGLQFCQRENGGAGTDSCVDRQRHYLQTGMYEAYFCCTMRYPEGLYWHNQYQSLFEHGETTPVKEENRYFMDDRLLVEDINHSFPNAKSYCVEGRNLILMPSMREVSASDAENVCLRVVF